MATVSNQQVASFEAGEAVATKYLLARVDTSGPNEVAIADAVTEVPVGVFLTTADAAGDAVPVVISGIAKVLCGDTVAKGDKLTAESGGRAVPSTTDEDNVWGTALEAGDDGDIIPMLVTPGAVNASA